jgi:hypothetical protein
MPQDPEGNLLLFALVGETFQAEIYGLWESDRSKRQGMLACLKLASVPMA